MPNTIVPAPVNASESRNGKLAENSSPSRASAIWKSITTSPLKSGLAICGVLSITALLLRKKQSGQVNADPDVEDFTLNQGAMLQRVREICDSYSAEHSSQ